MTKILIAVDGSKLSIKALAYVVRRKRKGERVEAYIVNAQPAISPRSGLITRSMIREYQLQECEKALGSSKIRAMKKFLNADSYLEIGEPASTLLEFAEKTGCDEIVIGSRGLGAFKGLLLGSVASKIIQAARIPVVVVK